MDKTVNHPPVPILQAVEMTTNWRNYYGDITGTSPNDAFRGFRIPLEDLQAMVDLAKTDPTITSARAYLALGEPVSNGSATSDEMHLLLVPVIDNTPTGTDLLEVERAGKPVSTIMDFTTPCPAQCDTSSVLYGPQYHQD
jgi:hypothetical protein